MAKGKGVNAETQRGRDAEMQRGLEERVRLLEGVLAGANVLAISYGPHGTLLAVAATRIGTVAELQAAKFALVLVTGQVDDLLLVAVEREVREQVASSR